MAGPEGSWNVEQLVTRSIEIIAQHQAPSGAYPACPNFSVYKYCWFRDGSFIADAMSRSGQIESAERFFDWCSSVVMARRERIEAGDRLDTRFTLEEQEATEAWGNFQLDGYGTWLWALRAHTERHNRSPAMYREAIGLTADYLVRHWQEPCLDWWEEREGVHAATLACIVAGLRAAERPEAAAVQQAIALGHERTDGSLLACPLFGAVEQTTFEPVLQDIERKLIAPDGGVHRHLDDDYYGGGEWLLLAGLLGWEYARLGRTDEAWQKLQWIAAQASAEGWLPEQSQAHLLRPDTYQTWVERWGKPARPLLWSHATFLTLYSVLQSQQ